MARISKVDACMICESIPCTCFAKAPKPAKPKATKPAPASVPVVSEPVPSSAPRVSVRDRMRAAATAPLSPPPTPLAPPVVAPTQRLTPPPPKAPPVDVGVDVSTRVSIRVLAKAGLLGADDRRKYSALLSEEPTVAERSAHWKRHHAQQDE